VYTMYIINRQAKKGFEKKDAHSIGYHFLPRLKADVTLAFQVNIDHKSERVTCIFFIWFFFFFFFQYFT